MSTFEIERDPSAPDTGAPTPSSRPSPPRSVQPLLLRLHFYAGVLVAPFILVAAITGGLYAVAPTIEKFVYSDYTQVTPDGDQLSLNEQVARAQDAYPDLTLAGVRPPETSDASTRAYFTDPALDDETLRAVFVDPYTGAVLGSEPSWFGYLPFSTWLDGLHRHLQLGEPGRVYSELAASWLWVVALGGLLLWFAKVRKDRSLGRKPRFLTIDRSTKGRARTLNWHGVAGIWILLALLFLSATGLTWSKYAGENVTELRTEMNWQRPALDASGGSEHAEHAEHAGGHSTAAADVDFDAMLAIAERNGVTLPLEITVPAAPGESVSVTEIDKAYRIETDSVAIDPATDEVTASVDYMRDYSIVAMLADLGIRLHMGFLFGFLNQMLLLAVVVLLGTVIVRGYLMWWRRRPTRGSRWAVGRPPARGGLRRAPVAASIGLGVCAVAVGWFFPLLGLTLAGFLVIDAGIAVGKRTRARITREA